MKTLMLIFACFLIYALSGQLIWLINSFGFIIFFSIERANNRKFLDT